jgi:hypothetical protein
VGIRNGVPHSTTKETPFEMLTGARPNLKNVRVFGCASFSLRMSQGSKVEPRADEGILLECAEHRVYKVLICAQTRQPIIAESRHVTFDESSFPGAACLSEYMSDEDPDDSDYASDGDNSCGNDLNSTTENNNDVFVDDNDENFYELLSNNDHYVDENNNRNTTKMKTLAIKLN